MAGEATSSIQKRAGENRGGEVLAGMLCDGWQDEKEPPPPGQQSCMNGFEGLYLDRYRDGKEEEFRCGNGADQMAFLLRLASRLLGFGTSPGRPCNAWALASAPVDLGARSRFRLRSLSRDLPLTFGLPPVDVC